MTDSTSEDSQPIHDRSIGDYLDALGSSQPAPGGGSVAGLMGALAAALGQMVISLSANDQEASAALGTAFADLGTSRGALLAGSEADERAYGGYIQATKLPKASDEERSARREAMQSALRRSAEAPIGIAASALDVLRFLEPVAGHGSRHALSDVEIAISLAHSAVRAGLVNVRVNVRMIKDSGVASSLGSKADEIEERASEQADRCLQELRERRDD